MRIFTQEEANDALEVVRPLVERLVGARRRFVHVAGRLEQVEGRVAGNGGGLDLELIDFPAHHPESHETVLLCWHLGEDSVQYWHGVEEGFAGRKPLPF